MRKVLDVPWISQLDASSRSPMDCGQACVLMLARFWGYASPDLTVDDLYQRAPAPDGTVWSDLQRLAASIRSTSGGRDFVLSTGPAPTPGILRGYIDQGYPPILLVNYEDLGIPRPDLASGNRQGLHWLVVSGYEDDNFLLHDPLWRPADREGRGGAYVPVNATALMRALRGVNLHHWKAVERPARRSKLGVHVIGGPRNGYGDFLRAEPALVKAVDEGGALLEARQISPDTVTIFRSRQLGDTPPGNFTGDPWRTAEDWMGTLLPIWAQNPADFYEVVNEPDPPDLGGYGWLNDFTEQCISIADSNGVKLCLYNFAAGVPEPDEFRLLLPSLHMAAQHGHVLGLHEYGLPGLMRASYPHLATRYRVYRQMLQGAGVHGLRIAITEAAPFGGYEWDRLGPEAFVDDVHWYDGELSRDDFVIGFALFTLGQWEGHRSNYQDVLPALTDYLNSRA